MEDLVTLRDVDQRLQDVDRGLARLDGAVQTALAEGARTMVELRDELRKARRDREDDRQRLTRVEDKVEAVLQARRSSAEWVRTSGGWLVATAVGILAWVHGRG